MAKRNSKILPDTMSPVDDEIDKMWGETVVLKPMKTESSGYRSSTPDPDRQTVIARGVYDQTRGAVEGTGGGIMHRQATVDTSLSIRFEPVEQCDLKKGDRVEFPERAETYEVTFIHPDPGGRPDVHLVRILET